MIKQLPRREELQKEINRRLERFLLEANTPQLRQAVKHVVLQAIQDYKNMGIIHEPLPAIRVLTKKTDPSRIMIVDDAEYERLWLNDMLGEWE